MDTKFTFARSVIALVPVMIAQGRDVKPIMFFANDVLNTCIREEREPRHEEVAEILKLVAQASIEPPASALLIPPRAATFVEIPTPEPTKKRFGVF